MIHARLILVKMVVPAAVTLETASRAAVLCYIQEKIVAQTNFMVRGSIRYKKTLSVWWTYRKVVFGQRRSVKNCNCMISDDTLAC